MTPSNIKSLRQSNGMSIQDMAEYLECNPRFVRQLETPELKTDGRPNKSHRKPSETVLNKLKELER